MMGALTAVWNRVLAVLGRVSMYRMVLLALAALAVVALAVSVFGLVGPSPLELIVSLAVLTVASAIVDVLAHRIVAQPLRLESSVITALILLFVLRPTVDPVALLGLALAAAIAAASKYVLAWRGRHIFNPAAVGAGLLTVVSIWVPQLGASAWWVGTPVLAAPVAILGLGILWRTEKLRIVVLFVLVAVAVGFVRVTLQYQAVGQTIDPVTVLGPLVWASPFLFLGAFMLTEPLTLPPRRWQQFVVAGVVGILAGWPIPLGEITLGQERALLIGNLVAFAFSLRAAVRLTLESRELITPTTRMLTFRARRRVRFLAGQYLELDVPHRHADARGTRREFSIASAPEDLPLIRVAFREYPPGSAAPAPSSYKRALADVGPGSSLAVTGIWGDFVLPGRRDVPLLMVAAGIGITPFVSQLRHVRASGQTRDIVLVYVASEAAELAFRTEIEDSGVPVVVFTRDDPGTMPANWRWARGVRLDAAGLLEVVPDLAARHAAISGPPRLIADLAPALERARSLTTDAFSGY